MGPPFTASSTSQRRGDTSSSICSGECSAVELWVSWLLSWYRVIRNLHHQSSSGNLFVGIQKYQNNPTSTSLDTKHYSIHNIDFPGITICANTKIMKSNFRTAMKTKSLPWRNLTQELIDQNTVASAAEFQFGLIQYLNNMAEFSIDPKGVELIENRKLEKVFDDRKGDIAKLMGIVAPSCNRMLLVCRQTYAKWDLNSYQLS